MIELLVWILVSYGLMNIMVYGKIFEPVREKINETGKGQSGISTLCRFVYEMITCPMCISVWIGFFLGMFFYSPTYEVLNISESVSWFLDGILSSGGVWIINSIVEFFEENRIGKNDSL